MPKVSIVCITYAADIKWLEYNLRSARKFCRGFSEFVIICPLQEFDQFIGLESRFSTPELPVLVKSYLEYPGKGMVHHEAMICYADVFLPESDFILHTDADCIFTEPVTPDEYIKNGKPVLVAQSFERLKDHGCYQWKAVSEKALGFEITHETMQRHPAVHHHGLYRQVRDRIEDQHKVPFIDFVLRQRNEFPQGFAEFPTLGGYAMRHWNDKYHWVEIGKDSPPKDKIKQSWSHWARRDPSKAQAIWDELESIVA